VTMTVGPERRFAVVARALRDAIIEHYHELGEPLDTASGRATLDTNSTLAPRRGAVILELLSRAGGPKALDGLRVADLGCGFGALSLYFATAGAEVVGIDPKAARLAVPAGIAADLGLAATFQRGWADDLVLDDETFDVAVANNSLCYLTSRGDRRRALRHAYRILVPGGWLAMRNPSRTAPVDPFTGLPLVHHLPPRAAGWVTRRRRPARSAVRLRTSPGMSWELWRAGFRSVRSPRIDEPGWRPARYHHHAGRRPPERGVRSRKT
jgi:SAM-dependent methyltransferase